MAKHDPYGPCPCGSGKKLKFCCLDIVDEVDTAQKMMHEEQDQAAVAYLETLAAKRPNRVVIENLLTRALLQVGRIDDCVRVARTSVEREPNNPLAILSFAHADLTQGHIEESIGGFQRALELMDNTEHEILILVALNLAINLTRLGDIQASRAHVSYLSSCDRGRASVQMASSRLVEILQDGSLPFVLRTEPLTEPPPPDAPWREACEAAIADTRRGFLLRAERAYLRLTEEHPQAPVLWRNLARVRAALLKEAEAAAAMRRSIACEPELHQRIVSQEWARQIDPDLLPLTVDVLLVHHVVRDADRLHERLLSSPQIVPLDVDLNQFRDSEDAPPPRHAYWLLDRPKLRSAEGVTRESVPRIDGLLLLFGRQTDREAHLDLRHDRDDRLPAVLATIQQLAGDALDPSPTEEVLTREILENRALSWQWQTPPGIAPEELRALQLAEFRHRALHVLPETRFGHLGGQTLREAAADPERRLMVEAILLGLQLTELGGAQEFDWSVVRAALGLDPGPSVDPQKFDPNHSPIATAIWLRLPEASIEVLGYLMHFGASHSCRAITISMGREILKRADAPPPLRAGVLFQQAMLGADRAQAEAYLAEARELAQKHGMRDLLFDLDTIEIENLLNRGDMAGFQRRLSQMVRDYSRDPQLSERLGMLLYQLGLVDESGNPVRHARHTHAPQPHAVPAAAESGKLWTPDSAAPAPAGEAKSGLWIPD